MRVISFRYFSGGSSVGSCSIIIIVFEWCGINIDEFCVIICGLRSSCIVVSSMWLGVVCVYGLLYSMRSDIRVDFY